MKITGWIAAFILFLMVLYFQLCQNKKAADTITKADYNAMVKAKDDTIKYHKEIIKADDAAIVTATAHAVESAERAIASEAKVTEGQGVIARLNAKLNAARKEKPDSSFIEVSPNYINGCDSLQLVTEYNNLQLNWYKRDNAALVVAKQYEINKRDTALRHRDQFNAAMTKQLTDCHAKLDSAINNQQRTQVYAGVGMLGNQINPIAGGQVNVSLKTKGNKIYEVTGAAVGGTWYVGLGTKFLISFRKK